MHEQIPEEILGARIFLRARTKTARHFSMEFQSHYFLINSQQMSRRLGSYLQRKRLKKKKEENAAAEVH